MLTIRTINLLLVFTIILSYSYGQAIEWTGGALDNKWHTPTNWDLNIIPSVKHDVFIMQANVDIDAHALAKSVVIDNSELFVLANRTLTIENSSDVY